MRKVLSITAVIMLSVVCGCNEQQAQQQQSDSGEWISLFNGRDLSGWKASETPGCFSVEDGVLKLKGGRSHLFYVGDVENADFKNFHFSAKVKTTTTSNSGIYFHTKYQEKGWPDKGYECQVNVSHRDNKRGGGLYGIRDTKKLYANDYQWYTQEIIVRGKNITTKIDGKVVVNYTEGKPLMGWETRRLSSGTFAIQGHDPTCLVYFKDIKVKPLK